MESCGERVATRISRAASELELDSAVHAASTPDVMRCLVVILVDAGATTLERLDQLGEGVIHHGKKQPVAIAEVILDSPPGDAGSFRDVPGARGAETFDVNASDRLVDDSGTWCWPRATDCRARVYWERYGVPSVDSPLMSLEIAGHGVDQDLPFPGGGCGLDAEHLRRHRPEQGRPDEVTDDGGVTWCQPRAEIAAAQLPQRLAHLGEVLVLASPRSVRVAIRICIAAADVGLVKALHMASMSSRAFCLAVCVGGLRIQRAQGLQQVLESAIQDGHLQSVTVAEVILDGPPGDACAFDDMLGAGGGESLLEHAVHELVDDPPTWVVDGGAAVPAASLSMCCHCRGLDFTVRPLRLPAIAWSHVTGFIRTSRHLAATRYPDLPQVFESPVRRDA